MSQNLEDRVAKLERELNRIKETLGEIQEKPDWIAKTAGAFRGDPVFAEIARLGKEIRDAEVPQQDE